MTSPAASLCACIPGSKCEAHRRQHERQNVAQPDGAPQSRRWVHKHGDHGVLVLLDKYEWSRGATGGQVHVRLPIEGGGFRLNLLLKDCDTAADAERKLVASGVLPDITTPTCDYRWIRDGESHVCGNRARAGRFRVTDRLANRHPSQGPALGPEVNLCHACARACASHNETAARIGEAV